MSNRKVGEAALGARLTDSEVELIRQLHEEFPPEDPRHIGYRRLAEKFGVSRTAISNYCNYRKRRHVTLH